MRGSDRAMLATIAKGMLDLPGGAIDLRDESARTVRHAGITAFRIASTPVTHEQYWSVRSEPPPHDAGPRIPVTEVSWKDAIQFCNDLSQASGLKPCYRLGESPDAIDAHCDGEADGYRLPSEAEWEYACRAGSTGVRYGELDEIAWHRGNSGEHIHEVATKAPNAWGLFDTIGNVWEWCWDVYDPKVYGPYRVFRGGGWYDRDRGCRASCRRKSHPTFRIDDLGFRLAQTV